MKILPLLAVAGLLAELLAGCASPGVADAAVQRLVSEDDHVRIDELRVRGLTQRLTVQNKDGGAPGYDILPASPGQDPSKGHDAAGQRVWQLLSF